MNLIENGGGLPRVPEPSSGFPVLVNPDRVYRRHHGKVGYVHLPATLEYVGMGFSLIHSCSYEMLSDLIQEYNERRADGVGKGHGLGGRLTLDSILDPTSSFRKIMEVLYGDQFPSRQAQEYNDLACEAVAHIYGVSEDVLSGATNLDPDNPRRDQAVGLWRRLRNEGRIRCLTPSILVPEEPPTAGKFNLLSNGLVVVGPPLQLTPPFSGDKLVSPGRPLLMPG